MPSRAFLVAMDSNERKFLRSNSIRRRYSRYAGPIDEICQNAAKRLQQTNAKLGWSNQSQTILCLAVDPDFDSSIAAGAL